VNLWWARKAQIADLAGDHSITQSLVDSLIRNDDSPSDDGNANAETAGVHIGKNVQVGPHLRIGGKNTAETPEKH
jgi:hypothetical protein